MPSINLLKHSKIQDSARTNILKSMMDYPLDETETEFRAVIDVDIPDEWNIGFIVGPSGSGKTTIAEALFGEFEHPKWDLNKCVFDNFESLPSDTVDLLCGVGLASVPTWLSPRNILSGGEGFRADTARILEKAGSDIAVIDEFTSVVDRAVAQAISVSVNKHARRNKRKIVCVGCHYDVLDWLQPNWIIDMADLTCHRRSLQRRPAIQLEIGRISISAWPQFEKHHYMKGAQPFGVRIWGAYFKKKLVAYSSYAKFPHPSAKNMFLGARLVVLPDYQGLGIGKTLENFIARELKSEGCRIRNRTAHPVAQKIYEHDSNWLLVDKGRTIPGKKNKSTISRAKYQYKGLLRVTRAYEYIGESA